MTCLPGTVIVVLWTFLIAVLQITNGQNVTNTATWCTVSKSENDKCKAFSHAVDREIQYFGRDYVSLRCLQESTKEDCMTSLVSELAQLTTLDPGEVFLAGRYYSLLPIMREAHGNKQETYQYAVAVIKKGSLTDVNTLYNLRGKKACFAGAGTYAGWTRPLEILMRQGGLEVIDCNNHAKSAINYFGPSCAVNTLTDRFNPLGDNSDHLCKLCIGEIPGGRCTESDPYAGYEGAFRCLLEVGEIAFLVHTTVHEMTSTNFDLNSVTKDQFELLCQNGTRGRVDEYESCNWGRVPSRAIVASSATTPAMRALYQRFLKKAVRLFGRNNFINGTIESYPNRQVNENRSPNWENRNLDDGYGGQDGYNNPNDQNNPNGYNSENGYNNPNSYNGENRNRNGFDNNADGYNIFDDDNSRENNPTDIRPIEVFNMFESAPRYGINHNLLFSDTAKDFIQIKENDQTFVKYLASAYKSILAVRRCTVQSMTLCVTSDSELEKCVKMRTAMDAHLLKPQLNCYKGHSQINCMQAIQNGQADITVLDASDVYTAGLRYDQVPFMSEVYNLGSPYYYVVAVAKESDENTDLTYLKNKYTCHTGINMAAGWVIPLAYLQSNGWIRGYGCDSIRAAAEYFSKSCVPGALSTEYNIGVPYDNMCDLCHGQSYRYCRRDASEDYFGYTGAFRCLVEGGGDVAFVKHTTVMENTNGRRKEFWARNTFTKDFQLLCPDATRRPSDQYEKCNLGRVKANAIVTRGGYYGYNETQINAYINLFVYAQQFYGKYDEDEFSFNMFASAPPYSDLIFQDATTQLVIVPPEQREYSAYLGPDFMRARRIVDCNAGASSIGLSLLATVGAIIFMFVLRR